MHVVRALASHQRREARPQVQVLVLLLALSLTQKPEEQPLSEHATSKYSYLFIYFI